MARFEMEALNEPRSFGTGGTLDIFDGADVGIDHVHLTSVNGLNWQN